MNFLSFCHTFINAKNRDISKFSFFCPDQQVSNDYRELYRLLVKKPEFFGSTIYLSPDTLEELYINLSITFLGERKIYWILNLETFSTNIQKTIIQNLSLIESPHSVFLVHNNKNIEYGTQIHLQPTLTKFEAFELFQLITHKNQNKASLFFEYIHNKVTPAMLILLISYSFIIGEQSKEFFIKWIPQIFEAEKSTFQISQAFLARDIKTFLYLFQELSFTYHTAFWCSFFSEQIFKAILFIHAYNNKQQPTNEITYRLPFSFIKKDWKLHNIEDLIELHQSITNFDIALKQGITREAKLEILLIAYMQSTKKN